MKKTPILALLTALACAAAVPAARAATNILTGPDQETVGVQSEAGVNVFVPQGLEGENPSIFRRGSLLGPLGTFRETLLENYGVVINPAYLGEVQGNPTGGVAQGVTYDGLLNVPLDIDVDRLTHDLTSDLTLHVNALWIHGQGLSTRKEGDFSNVSNIAGYNTVRLQELWLQQAFWRKRASLRLGILAADAEFFTSAYSALFINGTLGAFTLVGANLPDPPIYPVAVPGVRLAVQPVSFFAFQAGVYGGDSGGSQQQNNHGTNFNLRSGDGLVAFSEVALLRNQSPNDRGLVGTYKLGAFVHTGSQDFPTFASQARVALGTGGLENRGTDFGVYGIVDQELLKANGKTIGLFVRGGYAPGDANFVNYYVDGGFNFVGFIPRRYIDVAGIAVAHSRVSDDYSRASELQGGPGYSAETVFEATYRVQIAPWWNVQPDLQYLFTPSGAHGSHDARVLGVRTTVLF